MTESATGDSHHIAFPEPVYDIAPEPLPSPFNLFMHMGMRDARSITFEPPVPAASA